MKRSTSMLPTPVWFVDYSDCTIPDAILAELQMGPLTLPQIGNMRVNGHRLLGSYSEGIMRLRKLGYKIETVMKHTKNHTESMYVLKNPLFNPTR